MSDAAQNELRARARELLEAGRVDAVLGYAEGTIAGRTTPVLARKPDEADKLVLNRQCVNNLTVYLNRPEIKKIGKMAIVAKPADIKAIFVLIQENQVAPDSVEIIGVTTVPECSVLPQRTHKELLDYLVKNVLPTELDADDLAEVAKLDAMTPDQRWAYWQEQYAKCIRCYACRQVCPLCYCARCIVEKNRPQWVETSPHERGNLAWNITRAFHLAGRCVGCGECERACPMGIPLMKLNRKLAREVRDSFHGYVAGYACEGDPVLAGYRPDDPNDFFE